MTERIFNQPDVPFVAQQIQDIQLSHPNDWVQVIVDIYDERTILAASLYQSLTKFKNEGKI